MKSLIFTIMFIGLSGPAFGIHYVVDKDGTVRDTGRGGNGCVLGDTKVYLENGEQVAISKIKSTDQLKSLDNEKNENTPIVINLVHGFEKKEVYRISTESGKSIVATQSHPFYKEGFLYKASEFRVNDPIDTIDGNENIISIEKYHTIEKVYNVILANQSATYSKLTLKNYLRKYPFQQLSSTEHRLVLNGFISGDLILQKIQ